MIEEIGEVLLTGVIITDLHKAFGTINHTVLLQKLKQSNSQNKTLNGLDVTIVTLWWSLFGRQSENVLSEFDKFSCRFPQASILGVRHFLIYDNDITQAQRSNLLFYADYSCQCTNLKKLWKWKKKLNQDFKNV